MTLRYCHPVATTEATRTQILKEEEQNKNKKSRPLAILLAWMMAQEKHLEKYRVIYFQRGFDVLTVKTSPVELLFPLNGSQKVANNLIEYIAGACGQYPHQLVHAFSVGKEMMK